jgi:hypothetical protein
LNIECCTPAPTKPIVTILPGDVLEFREQRSRAKFLLNIDAAFKYAVRLAALKEAGEKGRKKRSSKRSNLHLIPSWMKRARR